VKDILTGAQFLKIFALSVLSNYHYCNCVTSNTKTHQMPEYDFPK